MFDEKLMTEIDQILRSQKDMWVNITDRGELTPTTIVIRDGKILAIVIAGQVDKNLGLKAAFMARSAFSAEAIVLACDAHCYVAESEDGYKKAKASWPDGLMQNACDQNGACDADDRMSDCLSVVYAHENGSIEMRSMTYDYHGKNGGIPFKWTKHSSQDVMKDSDKNKLTGYMIENVRTIMSRPKGDKIRDILASICGVNDPIRIQFHGDLAAAQALELAGFATMFSIGPDRAQLFLEAGHIDQATFDSIMATKSTEASA